MKPFKRKRLRRRLLGTYALTWRSILMLVLAGLLVFFVERIATIALPGLTSGWDFLWAALIVAGLIYATLFWQHDQIARQISARAETIRATDITGRPYLICGYSPIPPDREATPPGPLTLPLEDLTPNLEKATGTDGAPLKSWQQNIRVLHALKETRHLYILRPDTDQSDLFIQVLRHYFPEDRLKITLISDKRGNTDHFEIDLKNRIEPDYEDFRYVTKGIDLAIEAIARDNGIDEREAESHTVIDVTAGFKTFSIAAAIASLNRDLLFVYAGTGKNTGKVLAYDAAIEVGTPLEV